jgi:hypothetical protein
MMYQVSTSVDEIEVLDARQGLVLALEWDEDDLETIRLRRLERR